MTVSIVVPLYYGSKYIDRIVSMAERNAINAGLQGNVEVVLVNDSPEDSVGEFTYDHCSISVSTINNEENLGIHGSRVKGLDETSGEYILFLDMDDEISPNYMNVMLPQIEGADMAVCNGISAGRAIYSSEKVMHDRLSKVACLTGRNGIVSPGQLLIRKKSIPIVWKENILKNNGADDYFLYLLYLIEDKKINILDRSLYRHVTTGSNAGRDNTLMSKSVCEMCSLLVKEKLIDEMVSNRIKNHSEYFCDIKVLQRDQSYMYILDLWLELEEKGIRIADELKQRNIDKIVIYGAGVLGRHLIRQLEPWITIDAVLDKNDEADLGDAYDITMMHPEYYSGDAELMIITPVIYFEDIKKSLKHIYKGEMIALDVLLEGMVNNLE